MVTPAKLRLHHHPVEWTAPAPMWDKAFDEQRLHRPVLLRFATDSFMEELQSRLASNNPASIGELEAEPETWETAANLPPSAPVGPLKLYQPAHGRFYLVAASLVCRIPGMPDRAIDPGAQEKASFVLRRIPHETNTELAWVIEEGKGTWQEPSNPQSLMQGEERLPLFALHYQQGKRTRRVLAGFIPTASRETYEAGKGADGPFRPDAEPPGLPMTRFDATVKRGIDTLRASNSKTTEDEQLEITTFILLDLAEWLKTYIPAVWTAVRAKNPGGLEKKAAELYALLNTNVFDTVSWITAMNDVYDRWRQEEPVFTYNLKLPKTLPDLRGAVVAAIPAGSAPSVTVPALPKIDPDSGDQYVIRCIYERPCCKELYDPVVSEASEPFQIASFFDPDAPAREVRIVLPRDTSIKGLRRFQKHVSFIVSNKLRSQMERLRGKKMSELENGDLAPAQSFSFGMICTLSIPIITICAMILLMIILQLLNIVFWWLPFVKICFPIKRR